MREEIKQEVIMKLLKRITCTVLTAILLNVSWMMPVLAVEETPVVELEATVIATHEASESGGIEPRSTTFVDTSIAISYSSAGMYITIETELNKTGSVVGVKDITIQRQDGSSWTTVATSSGGESTNVIGCTIALTYTGAVKGETYRVTCVHYGNVDEYRELYHESVGVKCSY